MGNGLVLQTRTKDRISPFIVINHELQNQMASLIWGPPGEHGLRFPSRTHLLGRRGACCKDSLSAARARQDTHSFYRNGVSNRMLRPRRGLSLWGHTIVAASRVGDFAATEGHSRLGRAHHTSNVLRRSQVLSNAVSVKRWPRWHETSLAASGY